jgi:hypothetical protein
MSKQAQQAVPAVKPVAALVGEVLATPQPMHDANMPTTVPSGQPAPLVKETNAFTLPAAGCAMAIVEAAQGRLAAWAEYASIITDAAQLESATLALRVALTEKGYARAQAESSEWKAFAILYHFDRAAALRVIDPNRTVPKMKGDTVQKDSTGAIIRVRPTPDQIVSDIRAERDRLHKAGTITDEVYKPKAKPTKEPAAKIGAEAFDKVCESFPRMSADQFGSLWVRFLAHAASRADGDSFTKAMLDMTHDERAKRGWESARVLVPQS